jgi:uncharacterized protein involved in oxidation of intracellular sulfur
MKILFILNDPPYGTERSYNGLRLARELLKEQAHGHEAKVYLLGDATSCAKSGQKVPQGFYSMEALLKGLTARRAEVGVCGSCMDARGIADAELAEGCSRGSMAQLAQWTAWADKLAVF